MNKKSAFLLVFMLLISTTLLIAQTDDLKRIGGAIQVGNAKELAKYFETNVEITIFEEEEVYSKAQAELVLKDFFTKYRPSSFKIIHKGNSNEGSQYCIGTLSTENGTFRAYIYIKHKGDNHYIQEIRFESD